MRGLDTNVLVRYMTLDDEVQAAARKDDILRALDSILRTAQLHFEDKDVLWQALADYRQGRGDFSDYVIGRAAVAAGCSSTVTFDRELTSSALFEVL